MAHCIPHITHSDRHPAYFSTQARESGLLISNDELRDHIFQLLRPRHFLKWKERHIAHYGFAYSGQQQGFIPHIAFPAPYTACIQELDQGVWMVPLADSQQWLCVRPSS